MTNITADDIYNRIIGMNAIDINRLPYTEEIHVDGLKGWLKIEIGGITNGAAYVDNTRSDHNYIIFIPIEYHEYGAEWLRVGTTEKYDPYAVIYEHVPSEVADEAIATLPTLRDTDYIPIILGTLAGAAILYTLYTLTR